MKLLLVAALASLASAQSSASAPSVSLTGASSVAATTSSSSVAAASGGASLSASSASSSVVAAASASASVNGTSSNSNSTSSPFFPSSNSTSSPLGFNGTSPASSSTLIPSGGALSTGCAAFLVKLDSDPAFSTCLSTLNNVLPTTASSPSSSSLSALCSARACEDTTIRVLLSSFATSCATDLDPSATGAANGQVRAIYDTLYLLQPMREALCTKDTVSGGWCLTELSKNITSVAQSSSSSGSSTLPDATYFSTSFLPYLFISPTADSSVLCSPCGHAVLTAYAKWESATSYGFGLGVPSSPILGSQLKLWEGAKTTCSVEWVNDLARAAQLAVSSTGANGGGSANTSGASKERTAGAVVALMAVVVAIALGA